MNFKPLLFICVLFFSCKENPKPEDVDKLFEASISQLKKDYTLQTKRIQKEIADRGNKTNDLAVQDSILMFDSIINDYNDFILSTATNSPEQLQEKITKSYSLLKLRLYKEQLMAFNQKIDASEFFSIQNQNLQLKYSQVSQKDFLLYKKYLSIEWLLIALKFKESMATKLFYAISPFDEAQYYPLIIADRSPVAPGDTFQLFFNGFEYITRDLTFFVNGKPVHAKNGIAEIDLEAHANNKEKISTQKIEIKTSLKGPDGQDTILSFHTEYMVERY